MNGYATFADAMLAAVQDTETRWTPLQCKSCGEWFPVLAEAVDAIVEATPGFGRLTIICAPCGDDAR